ncbi:alanine--tRNA ligase [Candidatus Ruminimicrobiellum ovillum]|uniref:alanine--tRNA ligase n=1 Tax=Candidatus Ruminimicrobiellum ovillum TaxID=1947927 RepID=UPI0035593B36
MNKQSAYIRKTFLDFFSEKGCKVVPSDSLVPSGDKTLLFTSAGMVQFKKHFLGQSKDTFTRATSSQKCFRTSDIDQVGVTNRHLTFFEMLGNFSFGDYFKEEAIAWAWDFLTNYMQLPKEKLYATIYKDDDEAGQMWKKFVPESRIIKMGDETNFWTMGPTGPCGPCSEILIDLGEDMGCHKPTCGPWCDCNRYLEIWNLVFTQFDRQEDGSLKPLGRKNIDTGMGLERIVAAANGKNNVFDTDLFLPMMNAASELLKVSFNDNIPKLRMIADHARAITFLISDGIHPSNEGRGYVLRRILRRAVRQGKVFGMNEPFLYKLVDVVHDVMKPAYPELTARLDNIKSMAKVEEEKFLETLNTGTDLLNNLISQYKAKNVSVLKGEDVFKLYDTYGFPHELTKEIALEQGLTIDEKGFEQEKKLAQEKSRGAWSGSGEQDITFYSVLHKECGDTTFEGYTQNSSSVKVIALVKDGKKVESLSKGEKGEMILSNSPFYAESGGQVADTGIMFNESVNIEVTDVTKPIGKLFVHKVVVEKGKVKAGDVLTASINTDKRNQTARHHTATHLLQKVLRSVLGNHVAQAGSLVCPDNLRFDFNHFKAVTKEELKKIEKDVNKAIRQNYPVSITEMPIEQARKEGAMALFGEKYGDVVRTVKVIETDDKYYSMELCGGTHVQKTGDIGMFKIVSESSVGSGIRRIEAVCGSACEKYVDGLENKIDEIAALLKTSKVMVVPAIEKMLQDNKNLETEISSLKSKVIAGEIDEYIKSAKDINGINVIAFAVEGVDVKTLREMVDKVKEKKASAIIVIASKLQDKISFVISVSQDIVKQGYAAGKIAKQFASKIDGSGGGKPDFAQGGGKKTDNLKSVIENIGEILK